MVVVVVVRTVVVVWPFHSSFVTPCFDSFNSCSFLLIFFAFLASFASFIALISGLPNPFFSSGLSSSPLPFMSPESDLDFDHRLPSACHPSDWTADSEEARPGCFEPVGCFASTCGLQALFSTPVLAAIMLLALVRSNS